MKPRTEHSDSAESETSHLNVTIPRKLHKRLRQRAIEEDRPIGDLVADAIAAYLEARHA